LIFYFDTSALVKLYVDEPRADRARDAAASADMIATGILTYAEMRSAFTRKHRFGEISGDQLERLKIDFETDWKIFEIIPIDEVIARRAGEFAEIYSLKGFDAVQLSSADAVRSRFGEITFACFDADLSRAATSCGMILLPFLLAPLSVSA
jgi:predicted nucleic acid-binding protein